MKVFFIDNFDSFTYNLVQYFRIMGAEVTVRRNDEVTPAEIARLAPDRMVISPGPCGPERAGVSVALVKELAGRVPILGVCLGHQSIGAAFGMRVRRAKRVMHGKTSLVHHCGEGIYRRLPDPFRAARYHSLILEADDLPDCLVKTAWTDRDELMGMRHRELPVEGVQFHPESFLTECGMRLLANFLGVEAPEWSAAGQA